MLMPIHATTVLDRQRFGRLQIRDDLVDLSATQRALDAEQSRQRDHDITVRH
jgi:hypothetical protein